MSVGQLLRLSIAFFLAHRYLTLARLDASLYMTINDSRLRARCKTQLFTCEAYSALSQASCQPNFDAKNLHDNEYVSYVPNKNQIVNHMWQITNSAIYFSKLAINYSICIVHRVQKKFVHLYHSITGNITSQFFSNLHILNFPHHHRLLMFFSQNLLRVNILEEMITKE